MKPHLIMPMGGVGSRFYEYGYELPKPLIEIRNRPFFYWAVMSILRYIDIESVTFVVLRKHIEENEIDCVIHRYFKDAKIVVIPDVLPGPVFTALEGVKDIQDNLPLIFNDCDHMFKCKDLNSLFEQKRLDIDGALLTFESNQPQFSFVRYCENGEISGTVEKKAVSNRAICGAYIFKNVSLFRSIAEEYTASCPYSECFMSGMYNVMCKKGMKILDYLLDFHVEFGTPEEYETARSSHYFLEFD